MLYILIFLVLLLQHYDGDIKELCLDFTVTEESFGKRHVIELKPGGKDTCVTNENKMQYVHAMADYKLNRQVCNYFLFEILEFYLCFHLDVDTELYPVV